MSHSMAWVFVPCILVRVLLWSIHIFGLFGLLRMFAGLKLLWLVAGKVLADITIQFDDFNPFDGPDDPGPPVTSRFLRQLCLNDINSSVPRTRGIPHIQDNEADDDSSDDGGDNASANVNLPEERTMQGADVPTMAPTGAPTPASTNTKTGYDVGSSTGIPNYRAKGEPSSPLPYSPLLVLTCSSR
ncbi:hypothetical protein GGI16_001706 [Coemansia sp. S142-1]|nr:hypothetical protein GGI16_001706 [Coemansia sp. S142-1]